MFRLGAESSVRTDLKRIAAVFAVGGYIFKIKT